MREFTQYAKEFNVSFPMFLMIEKKRTDRYLVTGRSDQSKPAGYQCAQKSDRHEKGKVGCGSSKSPPVLTRISC